MPAEMPLKAPPPPPAPAWSWTGFYVGLNGGYGWNDSTGSGACINPGGVVDGDGCSVTTGNVISPDGGLFGAQAGYNWQAGSLVAGIETDIQWADINGSGSVIDPCCNPVPTPASSGTYSSTATMDWFGTTRGRIGFLATPNLLAYVTGGAIYAEEKVSQSIVFSTAPFYGYPASADTTRAGGVVGGGFEFAFNGNLSAKVEGLYYDMGTLTSTFTCPAGSMTCTAGYSEFGTYAFRGEIFRAGLNWHLGGGPVFTRD